MRAVYGTLSTPATLSVLVFQYNGGMSGRSSGLRSASVNGIVCPLAVSRCLLVWNTGNEHG
jgi:hypothetical protein